MIPETAKIEADDKVRLTLLARIQELEAQVADLQSDLGIARVQIAKQ